VWGSFEDGSPHARHPGQAAAGLLLAGPRAGCVGLISLPARPAQTRFNAVCATTLHGVTGSNPNPAPYIDEDGFEWESKIAYVGVGLKLECPSGRYVSVIIGTGGPDLAYQVLATKHPQLPWPPLPDSTEYGERCPCDDCVGRLVGDAVADIRAEADAIQATTKSHVDTYTLRHLETARSVIRRKAQLKGYGIHLDTSTSTESYVSAGRYIALRYDPADEVEDVTMTMPRSGEEYPNTLAGALAALRGPAAATG
jgi:hypothetical protein